VTAVNDMPNVVLYPGQVAGTSSPGGAANAAPGGGAPRPQALMLTFLGIYLLGTGAAVCSGSVIEVFRRVGVSQEATRSTLTRMVHRDLLARHRRGRSMYYGLTPRSTAVLRSGHDRVWQAGVVNRDWDGTWTMLGFSLPEHWRSQRHELRSRLIWAGFGRLQSGMWISPSRADVPALVGGLGLDPYLNSFTARTAAPTQDAEIVRGAFDIPGIAARYHGFLDRWDGRSAHPRDDLAKQLVLHADWLQLIRKDPRLPAQLLPGDWPAIRAEGVFHHLATAFRGPAREAAAAVLDTVPADTPASPGPGSLRHGQVAKQQPPLKPAAQLRVQRTAQ
jgi:phenylacetic acid degradation operon negative regulatory protein